MSVEFLAPASLWLLLILPALWWMPTRRAGRAPGRGRPLHVVWRAALVATVLVALAQPVLVRAASRVAFVFLVDASDSVSARALSLAADTIDSLAEALEPAATRILAFGGRDAVVADTKVLREWASSAVAEAGRHDIAAETSNIEQAVEAARAEIPAGVNGRIVLFSDGRENEGDSRRASARLAAHHVPVFAYVTPTRDVRDTWIESLSLSRPAVAGAPAPVSVVVGSQVEAVGEVTLHEGITLIGAARANLVQGLTPVAVDVVFPSPANRVVTARVTRSGDPIGENNTLSREVAVAPRPRVLYVQRQAAGDSAALAALVQSGFAVTRLSARALPVAAAAFDRWDVVITSNVARAELSPGAMSALTEWVERRGGGLLFAGGGAVVGESADSAVSGYRKSEIERLLPVTFDRDDDPDVALVIVLDRSWSMNGPAIELSKSAAEAAANTLAPAQMLGILSFSHESTWDVPLGRVRDTRAEWPSAIQRIVASGSTAIYPALENAYVALATVRARAKHVILLSDGRQGPDDFEGLVKKMSAARITVSSVALGDAADVDLLRGIATWGGGRSYAVADAAEIPAIFVKEAKNASTPGSEHGDPLRPTVRHRAFFADAIGEVPAVTGRNVVTRKPDAIELLATTRGDPLLTIWPAGLGRTAMLSVDLDGRWSAAWPTWRGFGVLLSSTVRALAPAQPGPAALEVSRVSGRSTAETVQVGLTFARTRQPPPTTAAPELVAESGGGRGQRIPLTQTAAGRYEATLAVDTASPIRFTWPGDEAAAGVSRTLVVDHAAEYRFGPANLEVLEEITRTTGGKMGPTAEELREWPARSGVLRTALARWLFGAALALWLVDVVVRRRVR